MTITRSAKFFCLAAVFLLLPATTLGQPEQRDTRPRNCAIYGRVSIGDQAAANAQVTASEILLTSGPSAARFTADGSLARTVYKVRADADGRYQFTGLPAGRFNIEVLSRAFVSADDKSNSSLSRIVTLDDGESRDKMDFALVRGGVITGRVTDSDGRPVIARNVNLFRLEARGTTPVDGSDGYGYIKTDDRGIYRAYGLRSGRYVVSAAGEEIRSSDGSPHRRTFHPNAINEKQAKVIELKAGDEAIDIDIKLALSGKRYEALGRVVDEETGKPLPYISISCGKVAKLSENQEDGGGDSTLTDAQGNFRLSGLSSGRYSVSISGDATNPIEHYIERAFFDIADENISGVEVKATLGGVISGVVVIEGASNPSAKANLSQSHIIAFIQKEGSSSFGGVGRMAQVNADGRFRIGGLPPGVVRLQFFGIGDPSIQLLRMERGGSEVKGDLVIGKGEKINDLRLVLGKGRGVIRGQVQIVGGQLAQGWHLLASARRTGDSGAISFGGNAGVDEKGRFVIEGLPGGEYDLLIRAFPPDRAGGNLQFPAPATQKVTVNNGAEVQVIINFDPTPKAKEGQ